MGDKGTKLVLQTVRGKPSWRDPDRNEPKTETIHSKR